MRALLLSAILSMAMTLPALAQECVPGDGPAPTPTTCEVTASTLASARLAYATSCSVPRKDCDPIGGGNWRCSSDVIGAAAPKNPQPVGSGTGGSGSGDSGGDSGGDPPPQPSLRFEAEDMPWNGLWEVRATEAIYVGPNRYAKASQRNDANAVVTAVAPTSGRYKIQMRLKSENGRTDEPANDVWVRLGNDPFAKIFIAKNTVIDTYREGGSLDRNHGGKLFADFQAGDTMRLEVSGRSSGSVLDWFELVRVGDAPGGDSGATGALTSLDLVSLHWDGFPDGDDCQAIVATREIMDEYPGVDFVAAYAMTGDRFNDSLLACMPRVAELTFPDILDGRKAADKQALATSWELTLRGGGRVFVAEGGPSDDTADVLQILEARGVPNLKRVIVVQHSVAANEANTTVAGMATVRRLATYRVIQDGNSSNQTPDYNQAGAEGQRFTQRALASEYGAAWQIGLQALANSQRVADFSDAVEVLNILGVPKDEAPDVNGFADRYFR